MYFLDSLFDHLAWADARARDAIATLPDDAPERGQALRLYAHIAAAEHVWLSRLAGREPTHAVWPELTLAEASALAVESVAGLRAIAADNEPALGRAVDYHTTAGTACRDTIGDILAHVALHGSYHRGQVALLVRAGGGAPPATDYIAFVRGKSAPPLRQAE